MTIVHSARRILPELERDYVEQTLTSTGLVSQFTYVAPTNPLLEARTATGGSFHSDGRVLVLKLSNSDASASPGNTNTAR